MTDSLQYAEECYRMAENSMRHEDKRAWLRLAEAWLRLAQRGGDLGSGDPHVLWPLDAPEKSQTSH